MPPHPGLIALRLHKGGRCNVLVIGVGARSNAFHSRRLKRANAIVNSSVHVGQGDVWNGAPLDCGLGTLRVDAEEVLASPPVTGLIPGGAGFSRRRVASSFHLRPGLVSSSPLPALTGLLWEQTASRLLSDATGVIGGSGRCCSHPA